MTLRQLSLLGLVAIGGPAFAAEPAKLPAVKAAAVGNQQLADAITSKLTSTGSANSADVSVQVVDGIVTLTGTCRDAATKDKVISDVRTVGGVMKVRDGLNIVPVQATSAPQPLPMTLPPAGPSVPMGPVATPSMTGFMPSPNHGGGIAGAPVIEPQPLGSPGMGSADLNAPPLPPYAWPTYAPHNNVSRVAYPQAYPYNAFPFIGPYYPFPKVPLGWRKVTLEWEDGHWWYGRNQTPNDYWRVRFW